MAQALGRQPNARASPIGAKEKNRAQILAATVAIGYALFTSLINPIRFPSESRKNVIHKS